jgi:hypothetical protein
LGLHLCNIFLVGKGKLKQPYKENTAQNEQKLNKGKKSRRKRRNKEKIERNSKRISLKNEEIVQEELTLQKGLRSFWGD